MASFRFHLTIDTLAKQAGGIVPHLSGKEESNADHLWRSPGIDTLAEQSAKSMDIPVTVFLPDYHRYQRGAPLKRNEQIVDSCDALLAVWNGKKSSKGTIYTFQYALSTGKPVFLIKAGKSKTTVVGNIAS